MTQVVCLNFWSHESLGIINFVRVIQKDVFQQSYCVGLSQNKGFSRLLRHSVNGVLMLLITLTWDAVSGREAIALSLCCLHWQRCMCQWLWPRLCNQAVLHEHYCRPMRTIHYLLLLCLLYSLYTRLWNKVTVSGVQSILSMTQDASWAK